MSPESPADLPERLPAQLVDRFGRPAEKLRISVTDRCNFRCSYCMPAEGLEWLQRQEVLSFEEILRLARLFVELGVRQIRLTGGEPLLRRDLPVLVEQLKALPGLHKLSITTNGTLLPSLGPALYAAGLRCYNVSLDSLQRERFAQAVRRDALAQVLQGLEALQQFSGVQIKLNVVLIRNFNDDEALDFAQLARRHGWQVRFIEFMPLGKDDHWQRERVLPGAELRARIASHFPLQPLSAAGKNPAELWGFADGSPGQLGFINSVSAPFCEACNRIRLTADGHLRSCLFSLQETPLKASLRSGASDTELKDLIRGAVWQKEAGHLINQPQFERPLRSMSSIGG